MRAKIGRKTKKVRGPKAEGASPFADGCLRPLESERSGAEIHHQARADKRMEVAGPLGIASGPWNGSAEIGFLATGDQSAVVDQNGNGEKPERPGNPWEYQDHGSALGS